MNNRNVIEAGQVWLGIEFGSTRIKAVLIGPDHQPMATGSHTWADSLENGVWTYSLEAVHAGFQDCYRDLKEEVKRLYGVPLRKLSGMGVSAMMHGYLAFDADMKLLTPFRTWRNTITGEAADELTDKMQFNIPQRWSIAHLHQAVLKNEEHLDRLRFFTTLAGYAHWLLTGEKVLGVGDAAGMFPIDSDRCDWDAGKLALYEDLIADKGYPWKLSGILPKVLAAGEIAGTLTESGARFLDPEGDLEPGVPLCPPEGDAGTGMVATNSIVPRTGNVSAGTSIFAMIVLEKALSRLHREIDMVTTPTGMPVAMVHCNTCTSDVNAWIRLLGEVLEAYGIPANRDELYVRFYTLALQGDPDAGGLTTFNYYSGEPVTETTDGVPMLVRRPDQPLTLANFMRAHILSALATLSIGMETLTKEEKVGIDSVLGHGGLFKTPVVGQRLLAAALGCPVTVMETAGEGGAWGIALLAAYAAQHGEGETLDRYLKEKVFAEAHTVTLVPEKADREGMEAYLERYRALLPAERAACKAIKG